MRTREQRWAARSARGWPRSRVHAIGNGLLAVIPGALLVYLTHWLAHFENFPAGDVAWFGRLFALTFAVLVPGVLITMGLYLVFAGFAARNREATAAGQVHADVVDGSGPDAEPATGRTPTVPRLRGVTIRAHRLHGSNSERRYTREVLGVLPVQSPIALVPLGVGILALTVATVYYATGYGRPALVVLAGVGYLGWKLWRGYRSYRAFSAGAWAPSPREETEPLPATPVSGTPRPVPRPEREGDDAAVPAGYHRRAAGAGYRDEGPYRDEAEYEITDELPVLERIRDTYTEPRKRTSSERRLAERAERERRNAERRDRARREPPMTADEDTTPLPRATSPGRAGRRGGRGQEDTAEQQEQLRRQERYRLELEQRRRQQRERTRAAEARGPEEAQSLLGYAKTRWRSGRDER